MNNPLDVLPKIADDRELQVLDAKIARAKSEAEQLVGKLRLALGEERDASEAFSASLAGSDRDVAKASERVGAATLARQQVRAHLEAVVAALDRLLDDRPEIVSAAFAKMAPRYHEAANAADVKATEAEQTATALRNLANGAKQRYLELEPHRRAPKLIPVRFVKEYRTADGGYQQGDVAGLEPPQAARVVAVGVGVYAESWRAALADAVTASRASSGG